MRSAALALVLIACGGEPAASPAPSTTVAPPTSVTHAAPYGTRFVRACSSWESPQLYATSARLVACNRLVYDDTGALRESIALGDAEAVVADRVLFRSLGTDEERAQRGESDLGWDDLVVYDATLTRLGPVHGVGESERFVAFDDVAYAAHASGLLRIDLATRAATDVEESAGCASALAIGRTDDGGLRCLVECDGAYCIRAVGARHEEHRLSLHVPESVPWGASQASWIASAQRWLVATDDDVSLLDPDGATITTRTHAGAMLTADAEGHVVVVRDGRTELWTVGESGIEVESIFDAPATTARFFGARVVLHAAPDDIVWLERGATALPPAPAPTAPDGFTALATGVDDGMPVFVYPSHPDNTMGRGRTDLAAFFETGTTFVVSLLDAAELSAAREDDEAWARLLAERVIVPGSQRWARLRSRERGARVLRGHTYIGGCERADIDVLARERSDGSIEVWTATGGRRRAIERVFGVDPPGTTEVTSSDRYAGDPSIGAL